MIDEAIRYSLPSISNNVGPVKFVFLLFWSTNAAHRFFDTKGKVLIGANLALTTLDAVGTCCTLAAGGHENWLPTHHCAPASVLIFAGFAFETSLAYIFHRTHHHKLERLTEVVAPADSVEGIIYTATHGGKW